MEKTLILVENFLDNYSNLMSLAVLFISLVSLIIAIIAFNKANAKSKIDLKYKEYKPNYKLISESLFFKNDNGYIYIDKKKNELPIYEFYLSNKKNIVAKNIIVKFDFIDINLNQSKNKDWKCVSNYMNKFIFTWEYNNSYLYKGNDIKLPLLDFNNMHLPNFDKFEYCSQKENADYRCKIIVTISAENMKTKQFDIPIRISNLYNPYYKPLKNSN